MAKYSTQEKQALREMFDSSAWRLVEQQVRNTLERVMQDLTRRDGYVELYRLQGSAETLQNFLNLPESMLTDEREVEEAHIKDSLEEED